MRAGAVCAVLAGLAGLAGCGGCGSGHAASVTTASRPATARPATSRPAAARPATSRPATSRPAAAQPATVAQRLCVAALHRPVAASSPTTVGDLRGWERGGPPPPPGDTSHRPASHAFGSSGPAEPAAYCTVGSPSLYTFYGAGPDGTAVRLEGFASYTGPVPSEPLPIP